MILENANFFEKMTACFGDISEFEQKIRQIAETAKIDLNRFEIDHLAVRMNDCETAERWRTLLLEGGLLLKESEINGRPICLFELIQAVEFCGQFTKIIELPFPKRKTYPNEGWEHIEIVFPMQLNESIERWTSRTLETFALIQNPALTVKVSRPQAFGESLPNPGIAISLLNGGTFSNACCLKLHPYAIAEVIRSESNF